MRSIWLGAVKMGAAQVHYLARWLQRKWRAVLSVSTLSDVLHLQTARSCCNCTLSLSVLKMQKFKGKFNGSFLHPVHNTRTIQSRYCSLRTCAARFYALASYGWRTHC
jgi:hypothetical protein